MAEQSNIGNIKALREWTRRYFYTKQDINYFMTKLNEGLKGYALMIIGPRNKRVTINPGNYQFTLNSDGWYRYLFFFNRNQEITLSVQDGITMNYQLDAYNDTICLSPWVIATPQMVDKCRPYGYLTGDTYNGGNWYPFNRNEGDKVALNYNNGYLSYEFIEPTIIYKVKMIYGTDTAGSNNIYDVYFKASNDDKIWTDIFYKNMTVGNYNNKYTLEFNIDDPKEYLIYRIFNQRLAGTGNLCPFQIYYYTVEQSSNVYRIATPIMSSNTSSKGEVVSTSSVYNNYQPWRAFAQITDYNYTGWAYQNTNNTWIQYKFANGEAKIIRKLHIWIGSKVKQFKFLGSNDGTNFDNLGTYNFRHTDSNYNQTFLVNNSTAYLYYRILITDATDTGAGELKCINMLEEV